MTSPTKFVGLNEPHSCTWRSHNEWIFHFSNQLFEDLHFCYKWMSWACISWGKNKESLFYRKWIGRHHLHPFSYHLFSPCMFSFFLKEEAFLFIILMFIWENFGDLKDPSQRKCWISYFIIIPQEYTIVFIPSIMHF